ncbi:MAG TPA: DUF3524 domain-containing protein [Anaerolineae bacterium]|nr:DUF3524 domain-containing protein [Anaerolineae bacterium]
MTDFSPTTDALSPPLNILLLSPYHGGSHQAWATGYQQHTKHQLTILSLPARFWKWRMHGGAITLAHQFNQNPQPYDLIIATDMLDLTTFLTLTRPHTATTPTALYCHENQLTYPLPADKKTGPMRRQKGERDLHYAFINYASMLAANHIFFNSNYHQQTFFTALTRYLNRFPEYDTTHTIPNLQARSTVLPVGIDFARLIPPPTLDRGTPPLILWNQRWEYDKNPAAFFQALYHLQEKNIPFRLAICGQNFRRHPHEFDEAQQRLADQIIHSGYADTAQYRQLLWQADITVSTAYHEFFGISILEAIYCHTFPLLPNNLSYPELIPTAFHPHCLYATQEELQTKLNALLTTSANERNQVISTLAPQIAQYDWSLIANRYDREFAQLTHLL